MIKVVNYGDLPAGKQKDILKLFLKEDSVFVSSASPPSVRQCMYAEDNDDYESIFCDDDIYPKDERTKEMLRAIVRTNAFLYCYKKSGRNKSRVLEEAQLIYDQIFSGQFEKADKKLLRKIMYYYALFLFPTLLPILKRNTRIKFFAEVQKHFLTEDFGRIRTTMLSGFI